MNIFRINIYLTVIIFLKSLLCTKKKLDQNIQSKIKKTSNKNYFVLTSRLRTGFYLLLQYLKINNSKKNEILFQNYNLPGFVQIAYSLGFKLKFYNNAISSGEVLENDIKKKISNKTLCVVASNILYSEKSLVFLKNLCKKKNIILIEDNAIYFDNYYLKNNRRVFSGSFGDYSLFSFNIMKNISAFYGGGVATNDLSFIKYANKNISIFKQFPNLLYLKQIIIFFILKLFTFNFIHKNIYLSFLKSSFKRRRLWFLTLVYPSLNFTKGKLNGSYFSKIKYISKKAILLQLKDIKERKFNFIKRKKNNELYYKLLKKIKNKNFTLLKISNFNFQNYLDFPIITKDKDRLNKYLLDQGIETKYINYMDCEKIFLKKRKKDKYFTSNILCLPSHKKISSEHIRFVVAKIKKFYEKN